MSIGAIPELDQDNLRARQPSAQLCEVAIFGDDDSMCLPRMVPDREVGGGFEVEIDSMRRTKALGAKLGSKQWWNVDVTEEVPSRGRHIPVARYSAA